LVTGPTGAGKTTTLYALLAQINSPEKHIVTLEDPVEYTILGVTQGQVKQETGFTFERGMRALLRQDPDIVLIGEMRDRETATTAIEAAMTGHLVLSTLHTNDAPSAIMRLMDMGIEPFLINAAVTGVLAQRLVRTICTGCRTGYVPTYEEQCVIDKLGLRTAQLFKGTGCGACSGRGYKGRIGVFELVPGTAELRSFIVQHRIVDDIYQQALEDGMHTMLEV
jgi:type II secretory ATPase GspE/PulE/Tfp pilus assembly ATPase PilB-like protein